MVHVQNSRRKGVSATNRRNIQVWSGENRRMITTTIKEDKFMNRTLIIRVLKNLLVMSSIICAGSRVLAQDSSAPGSGAAATKPGSAHRITLDEAKERAIKNSAGGKEANLPLLAVEAARYHRLAAQADFFPKVGATVINLHFNKFMGQQIQIVNRSVPLPLLNKDQTVVALTVTQPVTPLFKVREGVNIARADERIARAKAGMSISQITSGVEQLYYTLLIAQRQSVAADASVKLLEGKLQLASASIPPLTGVGERQASLVEATKALLKVNIQVKDLTQSLNAMVGLPVETELELVAPSIVDEKISLVDATTEAVSNNVAVIEAEQTVAKARAASKLSKMEYIPDVAVLGGYVFQTAIPLLPRDFSYIGVLVSYNIFDFGKRERTMRERTTQLAMAEGALEMTKAKVSTGVQKSFLDMERTRRILELTRRLATTYQVTPASYQNNDLEAKAARAKAEAELFQAELDYRMAVAQLKREIGR